MKLEPPADIRQWANMLRQQYVAMIDAGFAPFEAAQILGVWMANIRVDPEDGDG